MRTVAKARTSVRYDLVVAGGEAFGGQVLHIPVDVPFRCTSHGGAWWCGWMDVAGEQDVDCRQMEPSAMMLL